MPKGRRRPARARSVTALAGQGMKTRTMPIAVPIQFRGGVISTKARRSFAPIWRLQEPKLKLTSDR